MAIKPEIISISLHDATLQGGPTKYFIDVKIFPILNPDYKLQVHIGTKEYRMNLNNSTKSFQSFETLQPNLRINDHEEYYINATLSIKNVLKTFVAYSFKNLRIKVFKTYTEVIKEASQPLPPITVTKVEGPFYAYKTPFNIPNQGIEKNGYYIFTATPNRVGSDEEMMKVNWRFKINNDKTVSQPGVRYIWIQNGIIFTAIQFKSSVTIIQVNVYAYFKALSENVKVTWTKIKTLKDLEKSILDTFWNSQYSVPTPTQDDTPLDATDIVTYHIFWNTENIGIIKKQTPDVVKSEYKNKYKYIYHDKEGKEHIVCIVDWITIDKVQYQKPKLSKIPSGYISKEDFNIKGVNQKQVYKYSDGSVVAYGEAGEGGGYTTIKYVKVPGTATIVRVPEPLNYTSGSLKIHLKFEATIRKYMGCDHFAALIGALAECSYDEVISEGSAMYDGTCFPSVSHTNGESIDTNYSGHKMDQDFINACIKFGFNNILYSPSMSFTTSVAGVNLKPDSHHAGHLHCGAKKINLTK